MVASYTLWHDSGASKHTHAHMWNSGWKANERTEKERKSKRKKNRKSHSFLGPKHEFADKKKIDRFGWFVSFVRPSCSCVINAFCVVRSFGLRVRVNARKFSRPAENEIIIPSIGNFEFRSDLKKTNEIAWTAHIHSNVCTWIRSWFVRHAHASNDSIKSSKNLLLFPCFFFF